MESRRDRAGVSGVLCGVLDGIFVASKVSAVLRKASWLFGQWSCNFL